MKVLYIIYYVLPLVAIFYSLDKLNNFTYTTINNWNRSPSNIVETIHHYTGVVETHRLQTQDGYILTIFQIPRKNPKGVILLQHPIHFDARLWVSQYEDSIAFLFWKAGYDVWLGNTRGNFFCKEHTTLTTTDRAFWNFSFHEMGYYDNHAIIEYIKSKTTQSKIIFLGFSMGATTGLVYASTRPEEASRSIKVMVAMAPVTHLARGNSILKYIVPPLFYLQRTFNFVDVYSTVMGNDVWYVTVSRSLYYVFPSKRFVSFLFGMMFGWNADETHPDLLDEVMKDCCSETPLKVHDHFTQIYNFGGEFRMYSYGEENNLQVYGNKKPHFYPLECIKVPVFLIYGQNDSFICVKDSEYLYSKLPKDEVAYGKLMVKNFNHVDFAVGRNREEKVYQKILNFLERFKESKVT